MDRLAHEPLIWTIRPPREVIARRPEERTGHRKVAVRHKEVSAWHGQVAA